MAMQLAYERNLPLEEVLEYSANEFGDWLAFFDLLEDMRKKK